MKPQLRVMPIKKMLDWVATHENTHAAVLVAASYNLDTEKLPHNFVVEMFDDIDFDCPGRSITEEQANHYADFVQDLSDDTEIIICACNAGESRSAALCAALCEYYNIDSAWIWGSPHYHPNMLVFDVFTQALGLNIDDARKDTLIYTNRSAFTNAIKQARGDNYVHATET